MLIEHLGPEGLHIVHDRYYKSLTCAQIRAIDGVNFDHPDALDTARLIADLQALQTTGTALLPCYDFATHKRVGEERVTARPVVIVEGILVFVAPELRDRMDLRVFVEAGDAVRLDRRTRRDVATRGRTADEVVERFANSVRPMHAQFVEPSKQYADLVLDGTGNLDENVAVVLSQINRLR